jgi:predicted enzyme related to lactoylglutathione lyase
LSEHFMPRAKTGPGGLRGIRSVIYPVTDLARAKEFYATAVDRNPYFDETYYVGFDVDGQELGLDPDTSQRQPGPGGAVAYWRVDDIAESCRRLTEIGGRVTHPAKDVGGGLTMAVVADPFGNDVGLIAQADD